MSDPTTLRAFSLFYRCAERLGAGPDLLAVLGSFGDTLPDDDVFESLERYASGRSIMDEVFWTRPEGDLPQSDAALAVQQRAYFRGKEAAKDDRAELMGACRYALEWLEKHLAKEGAEDTALVGYKDTLMARLKRVTE